MNKSPYFWSIACFTRSEGPNLNAILNFLSYFPILLIPELPITNNRAASLHNPNIAVPCAHFDAYVVVAFPIPPLDFQIALLDFDLGPSHDGF